MLFVACCLLLVVWSEAAPASSVPCFLFPVSCFSSGILFLHKRPQRRLYAAETEIQALAQQGAGKGGAARVACFGQAGDVRPAGIGQAEQTRALVERFARRVVARRAKQNILPVSVHANDLRMPAGHDQDQQGKGIGSIYQVGRGQERGINVAFQMMYADKGQARA